MRSTRPVGHVPPALVSIALSAFLLSAIAASAGARDPGAYRAHVARTLNGTDTAHLRLVHQDEALLYEEGSARGALRGRMRAKLTVGSLFTGTCTIYTRYGSITGHGSATPHGVGRYQSFRGTLTVTGGTGRYGHVHGAT
ncbi:MAG: hypothetical protein ACRENC_10730, partial [Gemmatimonadaceae bacterium]